MDPISMWSIIVNIYITSPQLLVLTFFSGKKNPWLLKTCFLSCDEFLARGRNQSLTNNQDENQGWLLSTYIFAKRWSIALALESENCKFQKLLRMGPKTNEVLMILAICVSFSWLEIENCKTAMCFSLPCRPWAVPTPGKKIRRSTCREKKSNNSGLMSTCWQIGKSCQIQLHRRLSGATELGE